MGWIGDVPGGFWAGPVSVGIRWGLFARGVLTTVTDWETLLLLTDSLG